MNIVLMLVIVFLAAFVQGVVGFGFGMICMASLYYLISAEELVPLVSILSLILSLGLLYRLRSHFKSRYLLPLLAGGVMGIPVGVLFLRTAPSHYFTLALGIVIIFWVISTAVKPLQSGKENPRLPAIIAGFASGILGGAFNTGGPPVLFYISRRPWEPNDTKATLQAFFLGTSTLHLLMLSHYRFFTDEIINLDLILTPFVVLGLWAGSSASRSINRTLFRRLVLIGLATMGLFYLARGFMSI